MKKEKSVLILIIFCLSAFFSDLALAQENSGGAIIVRSQVKYTSAGQRDPFKTAITEPPVVMQPQMGNTFVNKPVFNSTGLRVEGIIWGGKIPQAIINGKVLTIGDRINEAEIISIDKSGIGLSFAGELIDLPTPGHFKEPIDDL